MPDWQERITHDTRPAIRAEHELRYALAAPLIRATGRWCDLGCGAGVGAAAALAGDYSGSAILVDLDATAAEQAARAVPASDVTTLAADLSEREQLGPLAETLEGAAADGPLCITCFEVVEHLSTFAPLVELLTRLAAEHACTVVLSVPNDAFWAIDSPYHQTTWGEGAVAELRGLLPDDHVVLHQVALEGSAAVPLDESATATAAVALSPGVPSHYLLAFGPETAQLATQPRVVQADVEDQRRWERQRESDILYYTTVDEERAAAVDEMRDTVRATQSELDAMRTRLQEEIERTAEFRAYIHELERRLGERAPEDAPGDAPDPPAASGPA